MKLCPLFRCGLIALLAATPLFAAPGDVQPGFPSANANNLVKGVIPQADGKLVIVGSFDGLTGQVANDLSSALRFARLNADGSWDSAFGPSTNGEVEAITQTLDGKLVFAGDFGTLIYRSPQSFPSVADLVRLNTDGTRDSSYVANSGPSIGFRGMTLQQDGKVLITGAASNVQSLTRAVFRINTDGTRDTGFTPPFIGGTDVDLGQCIAVQADGKILLGGKFTYTTSELNPALGLARYPADGSVSQEGAFTSAVGGITWCIAIQPDGKILVGGTYSKLNGNDFTSYLARLNSDGSQDTSFTGTTDGPVHSILQQCDGKVFIAGDFTTVNGVVCPGYARLNSDGTLDNTFSRLLPDVSGGKSVTLQDDGRVLIGSANGLARLANGTATESLAATSSSRVEWLRGGTAPEVTAVTFEQSTDGGASWTSLGSGTRISGGWELTGLSLTSGSLVRARAAHSAGYRNASSRFIQSTASYPSAPPVIVLEQPANSALTSGSSTAIDFGSAQLSVPLVKTFTLRNTGTDLLKNLIFSVSGTNAADFTVPQLLNNSVAAAGSVTFDVTFAATGVGTRQAVLHVTSNDPATPDFTVPLTAVGEGSTNANLGQLTMTNGSFTPAFDPAVTTYTGTVQNGVTQFDFTPTVQQPDATMTINSAAATSGSPFTSSLSVGANVFSIAVTAQNGGAPKVYTFTVNRAASVVQGDVEFGFTTGANNEVTATALQADGKMLVGGKFSTINGVARSYFARLNADNTLDTSFSVQLDAEVNAILVLSSGKIVIGGRFTSITPTSGPAVNRNCLAMLNADGSVDATFNPNVNNEVSCLALLPDGDIVFGGVFDKVQPNGAAVATTRRNIARVNANGTLDTTFNPNPNGPVFSLLVLPDAKIVVGGVFDTFKANGATSTTTRLCLARLNNTGTLDTTFPNPNVSGAVRSIARQQDGRLIITGDFSFAGGVGRQRIARLSATGVVDFTYAAEADGTIYSTVLQVDGKLVIGGDFTQVGDLTNGVGVFTRPRLARVNSDGTLDSGFSPSVSGTVVKSVMLQEDGGVIVGGAFTSISGFARTNLARLRNPSLQTLAPDGDLARVEWQRGPSLPETEEVFFDLSTDNGDTWTPLGEGTRIDGGWELTGLTLPATANLLRGRARVVGGVANASAGWAVYQAAYSPALAEIVVEQPENTILTDGDTIAFGTLGLNALKPLTFTLRNAGGLPLTGIVATLTGTNANQFSVTVKPPTTLEGLDSVTFVVQAKVTAAGAKTATLNLASNDADENPFNLTLTAAGAAAVVPTATTNAATAVDFGTATLNGAVDAKGQPRTVTFDYGTTTSYGSVIAAAQSPLSTTGSTPVTAVLTGLPPHTTFHYRVRVDGDLGDALGANKSFTTPNNAPVALDDTAINLPSAAVTIDVLDNDSDDDGDTLTLTAKTAVTPATAGTVAIVSNQLVFTASAAFGTGAITSATFGYTVSDGFGLTDTGLVTVTPGGATLDLTSVSHPSAGITYPVQLTTVGSWAVTEALSWATVTPAKGVGNATVHITLLPNTGTAARTGTVKIGGVTHSITQAGVVAPVVSAPVGSLSTIVGDPAFSLVIPTTNPPVTYSVTSGTLPPGVTINQATGVLSGVPTKGGSYPLVIKATNAKGSSSTPSFTISVAALDDGVVGTFHGYVERSETVNLTAFPNLGARFEMTVNANGSATGQLYEGVTKKSFTGKVTATTSAPNAPNLRGTFTGSTHVLDVTFNAANDTLSGTLHDAANVNSANVTAWGNAWTTTAPVNKATAYKGLPHTFAIENTDLAIGPQGFGFGSFIVTENTGALTITGRLPDGSALLCTTFIGQHGEVLLYQALHANKGSCFGKLVVTPVNAPTDNTLQGDLTWMKPASAAAAKDTVYAEGFPPLPLVAMGSTYDAPDKGQIVPGFTAVAAGGTNAKLAFTDGGLTAAFDQLLRIYNPSTTGLTNLASVPTYNAALTPNPNPNKVAMPVFTAATGAHSGSFLIAGATAAQNRTAPFFSQIVRIISTTTTTQGYGYFLLPSVPVGTQTVATSPKLSGRVQLVTP